MPGVGAFSHAMNTLRDFNLDETLRIFAKTGRPILGICLGMQMLSLESSEFGFTKGLGLCNCKVDRLGGLKEESDLRLPHVSWGSIKSNQFTSHWLFDGIEETDKFYFIHSFGVKNTENDVLATSKYKNIVFASVIENKNVIGTQFHPEKSGVKGLKMLENFINKK